QTWDSETSFCVETSTTATRTCAFGKEKPPGVPLPFAAVHASQSSFPFLVAPQASFCGTCPESQLSQSLLFGFGPFDVSVPFGQAATPTLKGVIVVLESGQE